MKTQHLLFIGIVFFSIACKTALLQKSENSTQASVRLITLDPGHFHAALVQKTMYNEVDPLVHVYAPAGPDVQLHLERINTYNARPDNPTTWKREIYTGNDFLEKMLNEKRGML